MHIPFLVVSDDCLIVVPRLVGFDVNAQRAVNFELQSVAVHVSHCLQNLSLLVPQEILHCLILLLPSIPYPFVALDPLRLQLLQPPLQPLQFLLQSLAFDLQI